MRGLSTSSKLYGRISGLADRARIVGVSLLLLVGAAASANALPTPPTGLTVTPIGCNSVSLAWNPSTAVDVPLYGYKLFRDGVFFKWEREPSTSSYDVGLAGGTTYTYSVVAVDDHGNPSAASVASLTTPTCSDGTAPSVPTALTASPVNCGVIALAWGASTDTGGAGLRGYRLYRNGAFLRQVLAPATSAFDTGLAPSTTYTYAVSAVDGPGNESATSRPVTSTTPACTINNQNQPPHAVAGPDVFQLTLTPAFFSAAGSFDADDGIVSYAWDFGDGSRGFGLSTSHVYGHGGVYTVTLTVTDQGGLSATDTATVYIINRAPVANAGPDRAVTTGTAAVLNGGGSYDPDGAIVSYFWTFGDGSWATGARQTHVYTAAGVYPVALTVTDDFGVSATDSLLVTVTPAPTSGVPSQWARRLGGASADIGHAVAIEEEGAVVVAGRLSDGGGPQMLVAKYSATGTQLWSRTSTGTGAAEAYGVARDGAGNVVVVGWLQGTINLGGAPLSSVGSSDIFVAKYSGVDGAHLWSRRYGGAMTDIAYGVAVDTSGDVVVIGFFQQAADLGGGTVPSVLGELDTFVAKYAGADGSYLWARDVGGAGDDLGYAVATDASGGVFVTGFFTGRMSFGATTLLSTAGSNNIFVAKLAGADGTPAWAHGMGSTGSERGYDVAVDRNGDLLVAGFFQGTVDFGGGPLTSAGSSDVFVAKYTGATGGHLWSRSAGGPGEDYAYGVAVDANGDAVVTGRFKSTVDFGSGALTAADSDVFVAKYAGGTGAPLWSRGYGGPGVDMGNAVATAGTRIVVTGSFESAADFSGTLLRTAGFSDLFLLSVVP